MAHIVIVFERDPFIEFETKAELLPQHLIDRLCRLTNDARMQVRRRLDASAAQGRHKRPFVQRLAVAGTEAYLPEELDRATDVAVGIVTAPVWGFGSDPSIEVSVHVYRESVPVADVRALATRVAAIRERLVASTA